MNRSAADVEREVEASRAALDQTVGALKEKMKPELLLNEAGRAIGGAGNKMMTKVVDDARGNAMPLALIGLGLAWMMSSQSKRTVRYENPYERRAFSGDGYYDDASRGGSIREQAADRIHGLADKASGAAHSVADKAADLADRAKSGISGAASHAADGARSTMGSVSSMAGTTRDNVSSAAETARIRAGEYGRQAKQQFSDTMESEPLLIAAVGVALGVALGAALPATAAERRYIGPARDKLLDKGKALAQEQLDTAKDVAQAAYGKVKEELQRPDGGDVGERIGEAARAGVEAVRDGVQGQSQPSANGVGVTH